jgi:probable HAF family extracellular repeat protein
MFSRDGQRYGILAVAAAGILILAGGGRPQPAEDPPSWFLPLGDLTGGAVRSLAHDVSADGTVVVGESDSAPGTEAFVWTRDDGMRGLSSFSGGEFHSVATGVSGDGAVVVGYSQSESSAPTGFEAFRWTEGSVLESLGDLAGGDYSSIALAASHDGSVIVGRSASGNGPEEAFHWSSALGMQGLADFPGGIFMSRAEDVSSDGKVIVGSGAGPSGIEAFHWTETGPVTGDMNPIGDLPGGLHSSLAHAVSRDGKVAVGFSSSSAGIQAFRWEVTMEGLGDLPGGTSNSVAFDCSEDGSVIVGQGFTESGPEASVWTEDDGMRRLADLLDERNVHGMVGWTSTKATGVSADGTIVVGSGTNLQGDAEAFAAKLGDPVPEPDPMVVRRVRTRYRKKPEASTLVVEGTLDLFFPDVNTHSPDIVCLFGPLYLPLTKKPGNDDTLDYGDDDGDISLSIKADRHGSSRTSFRLKRKGSLAAETPLQGVLTFRIVGGEIDVAGEVRLQKSRFGSGKKPGDLVGPHLALLTGKVGLGGKSADTLKLAFTLVGEKVGFDPPPDLTLAFGGFTETVPGASFVEKGSNRVYKGASGGLTKVVLSPAKEVIQIRGVKLDLGDFPAGANPVRVSLTLGDETGERTVTMFREGDTLRY